MDLTKSKTHIRDSEEHPESLPVFIALDETGSMGSIPDQGLSSEVNGFYWS